MDLSLLLTCMVALALVVAVIKLNKPITSHFTIGGTPTGDATYAPMTLDDDDDDFNNIVNASTTPNGGGGGGNGGDVTHIAPAIPEDTSAASSNEDSSCGSSSSNNNNDDNNDDDDGTAVVGNTNFEASEPSAPVMPTAMISTLISICFKEGEKSFPFYKNITCVNSECRNSRNVEGGGSASSTGNAEEGDAVQVFAHDKRRATLVHNVLVLEKGEYDIDAFPLAAHKLNAVVVLEKATLLNVNLSADVQLRQYQLNSQSGNSSIVEKNNIKGPVILSHKSVKCYWETKYVLQLFDIYNYVTRTDIFGSSEPSVRATPSANAGCEAKPSNVVSPIFQMLKLYGGGKKGSANNSGGSGGTSKKRVMFVNGQQSHGHLNRIEYAVNERM